MGAIGGLLGAWFNSLNKHLTLYRMKHVFRKNKIFKLVLTNAVDTGSLYNVLYVTIRILEVILIAATTTCLGFYLSTLLGTCVPELPSNQVSDFTNSTRVYFCPKGGVHFNEHAGGTRYFHYYNDMATLVFNSQEDTIKQLFHQNGGLTQL